MMESGYFNNGNFRENSYFPGMEWGVNFSSFSFFFTRIEYQSAMTFESGIPGGRDRLDKYWSDQPLLCDFKAELAGTGVRRSIKM